MVTKRLIPVCILLLLLIPISGRKISLNCALEVTADTRIELNDVVKLNYTLWVELTIVEQQNGTVWIHDPGDPNAPSELYEQFPDLTVPPNLGFLEGILGMKAGDNKTFDVEFESGKAFNNETDPYFSEDLTYQVVIFEILLDSTEDPTTLFDIPFFLPFLYLLLFLLTIIIYYRIKRFSQARNLFGSKIVCHTCGEFATVQCGNPSCNTPYCKDCFVKNNHCNVCHSNKMIPLTGKS
jgi:hypothetical protein